MRSLASHRESSKRRECRFAIGTKAVLPRAVRPLAASARSKRFDAASSLYAEPALSSAEESCLPLQGFLAVPKSSMFGKVLAALCEVTACLEPMQALRRSAKPNARGRAGTSCCAARAGGVRLLAGGATQRTMRAGRVPQDAMPNPSIERDVQELSLLAAPHVKR